MGGCRCSYRNCSLRTDGKTHMFHYPVFDKVRCHQWLTNAHKLEFLNLKVSQLKNRVVCQHHFKDDNFMNFKKDKLTFDAVPTEDGPYCDTSQLDETKSDQEESKAFSIISLDDIENEYLSLGDKKANFSVKYGDFLTNCDLMDMDSLNNSFNQMIDTNQAKLKRITELEPKPNFSKDSIPSKKRPVRKVRPLPPVNRKKNLRRSSRKILTSTTPKGDTVIQGNVTINPDNTVNVSELIETPRTEEDPNSLNFVVNVSEVPIEFESTKSNKKIQQNTEQSSDAKVLDDSNLLYDQSINVKASDDSILFNDQPFNEPQLLNNQLFDVKVLHDPKFNENNAGRNMIKERKKIRIISEKKISEPVPIIGKLEPVSPTRILTFPNKRRFVKPNPIVEIPEVPIITSSTETSTIASDTAKENIDNINVENSASEPIDIIREKEKRSRSRRVYVSPQEIRTDVINIISNEVLPVNSSEKTSKEIIKTPNKISPRMSLLKNNLPPERVAAIAEKRKFNMKLRDIIEDCLDKLDEPHKTDLDKRKLSHNTKIMESKKQKVGSYLAKDPELPSVQDYTIAYLEARMKKMEDNLIYKIGENSKNILELKQVVAPPCEKKNVHTQTSLSEDGHKRQLYQEISKYLSQDANSLIYEELFINKYVKDVPKESVSRKRRKFR